MRRASLCYQPYPDRDELTYSQTAKNEARPMLSLVLVQQFRTRSDAFERIVSSEPPHICRIRACQ